MQELSFKIGDRVINNNNSDIGYIEAIEIDKNLGVLVDVRLLTPNNEPSCCISICDGKDLTKISEHVIPMPKSKKWWAEANIFNQHIINALKNAGL